jgi:hypothetical protein
VEHQNESHTFEFIIETAFTSNECPVVRNFLNGLLSLSTESDVVVADTKPEDKMKDGDLIGTKTAENLWITKKHLREITTALRIAAIEGNSEILRFIISRLMIARQGEPCTKNNIDPNILFEKDEDRRTPLCQSRVNSS